MARSPSTSTLSRAHGSLTLSSALCYTCTGPSNCRHTRIVRLAHALARSKLARGCCSSSTLRSHDPLTLSLQPYLSNPNQQNPNLATTHPASSSSSTLSSAGSPRTPRALTRTLLSRSS
eukprot:872246-Rhodomonas_salina.1